MNSKYIKSIFPIALLAITLQVTSCVGDLDVKPIDPNIVQDFDQDGVFAKIYATMALTGQEGPAGKGDVDGIDEGTSAFYRLIFTVNQYPSDETICSWTDDGVAEMNFIRWSASHGMLEGLYGRLNFDVTLCNHFLEMTDGATDEKTVRQRAEARFIRAMNFFYLMDIFGNVPFTEVVTSDLPDQIKRADLYKFIENELLDIEDDMYAPMQAPYGRADKVACWLLLSRLYLNAEVYTGTAQWSAAATYAKAVMDSSYDLAPVYSHLFMSDNDGSGSVNKARQEIILPIRYHGINTTSYGGAQFLIAATHRDDMNPWGVTEQWAGVRSREALINKFFPNGNIPMDVDENGMVAAASDDRALFFSIGRELPIENPNEFLNGLSVAKFTNLRADGGAVSSSVWVDLDIPFMRVGEAYLTYAEALLRSGGSSETALNVINELRARSNAAPLATISLDIILDERSRELYFETHRRTDLIRYGYFTGTQYLWDWKGGSATGTSVSSIYNLCPIPAADLKANEKLVQNPGY
ncbi:MAG: RagB/SusD family nutrient uptake outer membrane protein [Bacteroides sp.]|nr:RagB/SusD family nutrient uptake outer membrane protein [Bacteroides sp.]